MYMSEIMKNVYINMYANNDLVNIEFNIKGI